MEEKLLLITKYDGWKVDPEYPEYTFMYKDGAVYELKDLAYLTDLNMLHPVAMKVKDMLGEIYNNTDRELTIKKDADDIGTTLLVVCSYKPNSKGEYINLFNSVCEGIELINRYKNN